MPQNAAFHLGLHCLQKYPFWGFPVYIGLNVSVSDKTMTCVHIKETGHPEYQRSLSKSSPCIEFVATYVRLFWFGLILYVPVNSYGHVGTVSSPNHTFFLGKPD